MMTALFACSAPGAKPVASPGAAPCRLVTGEEKNNEGIRIGIDVSGLASYEKSITSPPSIYASFASLAFLDCEGNILPSAAASWQVLNDGRTWLFNLRRDLKAKPGTVLSANAIREKWQANMLEDDEIQEIAAADKHTLLIHFNAPHRKFPRMLLSPLFSLSGLVAQEGVAFVEATDEDGRDALEGDLHGLLTRDPDVIEYAGLRSEWVRLPLAWDRSYVLVIRAGASEVQTMTHTNLFPESLTHSMVRNVVIGEARPFDGPAWWQEIVPSCGDSFETQPLGGLEPLNAVQTIRYIEGDRIAQGLAERMVALASGVTTFAGADSLFSLMPGMKNPAYSWTAKGMVAGSTDQKQVTESSTGYDAAFILPLPRTAYEPCMLLRQLQKSIPEIFDPVSGKPYLIIPLIDVRPSLILKEKRITIDLDGFGRAVILEDAQQRTMP